MENVNVIIELANAFLHIFIGYVFFSSFWRSFYNKIIISSTIIISTILFTISLLLFKGTLIIYIPMIILTFILALLFNSKKLNKILATIIYLAINGLVEMLVGFFLSILFSVDINTASKSFAFLISGMLISKFIVFLTVLLVRIKKQNALLQQYKKKYLSIFLFPASTLSIAVLQAKIFIEYPNQDMVTRYGVLVSYVALILANIIVFDFIDSLYINTLNESKLQTADEIILNQTLQYQALIDHNKNILKIRHDHKNFCVGLRAEIESGNIGAAIEILNRENNLSKNEDLMLGNVILAIIDAKRQSAFEKNIELLCEYKDINQINVQSTDLAIIIGNALDNAIEACERFDVNYKKYIEIDISLKNGTIFIVINNPVISHIDTNNLISSKKDKAVQHGFGIISIKQIANKYQGEVLFSCENNIFTTVIMLKNKI